MSLRLYLEPYRESNGSDMTTKDTDRIESIEVEYRGPLSSKTLAAINFSLSKTVSLLLKKISSLLFQCLDLLLKQFSS
jgi:hypothetical protein